MAAVCSLLFRSISLCLRKHLNKVKFFGVPFSHGPQNKLTTKFYLFDAHLTLFGPLTLSIQHQLNTRQIKRPIYLS